MNGKIISQSLAIFLSMRHLVAKDGHFFQEEEVGGKDIVAENQAALSHHWPVDIPKGPFLTIQNFSFRLVLFPIDPERVKEGKQRLSYCFPSGPCPRFLLLFLELQHTGQRTLV